jgi:hypothetical protein
LQEEIVLEYFIRLLSKNNEALDRATEEPKRELENFSELKEGWY